MVDFQSLTCVPAHYLTANSTVKDYIQPPFISVLTSGDGDYTNYEYAYSYEEEEPEYAAAQQGAEEGSSATIAPNFEFESFDYPVCGKSQELQYLLSPDNNVKHTDFYVDDTGTISADSVILYEHEADETFADYCVDASFDVDVFRGTISLMCATEVDVLCQTTKSCVSLCCKSNYYFDPERGCQMGNENLTIPTIEFVDNVERMPVEVDTQHQKYIFENMPKHCNQSHSYNEFKISSKSSAWAGDAEHNYKDYCVGYFGSYNASNIADPFADLIVQIVVCAPDDPYSQGYLKWVEIVDFTLVPILFGISIIFLILLFIYVFRKNRSKLFGVMTLCLVAMLFWFYVFLIIAKLGGGALVEKVNGFCILLGYMMQYVYLSAIFWLSAMSFDI